MRKALAVGRKEFRQIARDRLSLLILMFIPAFFLLLYGYALNFDVQHIRLAVHDNDRTLGQPQTDLGVRQLRLLRPGGIGHERSRIRTADRRGRRHGRRWSFRRGLRSG